MRHERVHSVLPANMSLGVDKFQFRYFRFSNHVKILLGALVPIICKCAAQDILSPAQVTPEYCLHDFFTAHFPHHN